MNKILISLFSGMMILFLSACNEGSISPKQVTGTFLDSAVQGLNYTCSSGVSGITDALGAYKCNDGDNVSFFIGTMALATLRASSTPFTPFTIFPNNFEAAINLGQLLQTLNINNDSANGINLDSNLIESLNGQIINFTSSNFDTSMSNILGKSLVSEEDALDHLNTTLEGLGLPRESIPDVTPPVLSASTQSFTTTVGIPITLSIVSAIDNRDASITVVQTGSVDFSTIGRYTLTYTATDSANNSASITRTVIVTSYFPSNSAPIFSSVSSVSVNENQTAAITLLATDTQSVTYSISGTDGASFNLDPTSGVVTFKVAPDFETKNSYTFTATASDGSLSIDQSVTIKIKNVVETFSFEDEKFKVILKTGQTTSYVANDDGASQNGKERNYIVNVNGTVMDNATGLLWQKEDNNNLYNMVDADTYCSNLVIKDWTSFPETSLDSWRLPTLEELMSLTDKGRFNPAINPIFTNTHSSNYWSSSAVAYDTSGAWSVDFNNGNGFWDYKAHTLFVRCVISYDLIKKEF